MRLPFRHRSGCRPPLRERANHQIIDLGCAFMQLVRAQRKNGALGTQIVVVALGVATAAREAVWPSEEWWESVGGKLLFIGLTALTAIGAALVAWGYKRVLAYRAQARTVDEAAKGIALLVKQKTSLKTHQFGVNIWIIRGALGFRRLVRWSEIAPDHHRTPILWTKGKGVIGQAWKGKRTRSVDLERIRNAHDEESWCARKREERLRLSWDEFEETGRYHHVIAVPLRARRFAKYRVCGVIAIDSLVSGKKEELEALAKLQAFSSIRRLCESAFSRDEPPREEA